MKILAVIHARGGSKRIPLKNLAELGGKPLLAYPIELAKASKHINRVILSTDHPEIIEVGKKWGAEVPFIRPADISEDVPSELVTLHAVQYLIEKENYRPDLVITLTPATPFTKPETLDKGIDLLLSHPDWSSVVPIRKANEFPEWTLRFDPNSGLCQSVLGNPLDGFYNVSQNLPKAFYPAGSFFINRTSSFLNEKALYGSKFGGVLVDSSEIDIDEPEDLEKARMAVTKP